ncbi:AarF/ABC1/UbiB kinase family protein [Verrucomicrobiaceae bacterium N1E253]|uniref:AarF/ABC1/UbiB kinase family protein n=1 Tax=Oceaniferula marina TaxID=2748318 RepID=A0A851GJ01_9BACT|nr:AarF/ABC1/UbiB kinase family protein [Oceaniferula marina]NWK56952.1 AarF/ABC1/UbiB kinase family protein [Oceaniferula marina]
MKNIRSHTNTIASKAKRQAEIIKVFSHYGLADWFAKIPDGRISDFLIKPEQKTIAEKAPAERLRLALTALGPTFIKFGQVLSTRADMVGPEIAAELQKLQSHTPADPPEQVEALIIEEFGKNPNELFSSFDSVAFSSASIGQVHRARLKSGDDVVVKVQHIGIEPQIRLDLDLLGDFAKLIEKHVPESEAYQPVATTREFGRNLLKELDFTSERRNMERFTRNFQGDETLHVPVVFAETSSRRVLTMELLEGISGSQPEDIASSGADLSTFAKRAANIYLNMILRDGFYHADPHPGNFYLLNGGVLGLLDSGMVGRIDDTMREEFENVLLALVQADAEELSELLLRYGSAPQNVDKVGFRTDIGDLLDDAMNSGIEDIDLGDLLAQVVVIMRRYSISMSARVALIIKTLVMLEGTSKLLSPHFSLIEVLEPFRRKIIKERLNPRHWWKKMRRQVGDIDRVITSSPRALADLIDSFQSGQLKMKHEVPRLEITINRVVAGVLIASFFLGSSLLLSFGVPPKIFGLSALGTLGCLSSLFIGLQLLWSIRNNIR